MADDTGVIATIDSISVMRALMDEREQRYTERHNASQLAVKVAFEAHQRDVSAALIAADKLNSAELAVLKAESAAAERAVLKSEAASEKRFAAVNEFRQALGDQAALLISRNEVNARFEAITEKVDVGLSALSKEITLNLSRLDRFEGSKGGASWLAGALTAVAHLLISMVTVGVLLARH